MTIWQNDTRLPSFEPLDEDISVDALVIGGGLCGLLTLHELQRRGVDAALIEADTIMSHTSGGTTAKITSAHSLIYRKTEKKYGSDKARLYLEANEEAIHKYRELAREIDCNFEERSTYVYSLSDYRAIKEESETLKRLGSRAELTDETELPFQVAAAIKYPCQAQFDPLKFAAGIANGSRIYENTRATDIKDGRVITNKATVRAKRIIVATRFPVINRIGLFFMKMYQCHSYAVAIKSDYPLEDMHIDAAEGGIAVRRYGEHLIVSGGGGRDAKGGGIDALESFAKRSFGGDVTARWEAEDCITLDGIPYIGKYSKMAKNIYTATGFNEWGMTSAMISAEILADELMSLENKFSSLFSPFRSMLSLRLRSNGMHTAAGLIKPKAPRCPHLGCALKWNSEAKSWDCSCHGSRFDKNGAVMDGPANRGLSK